MPVVVIGLSIKMLGMVNDLIDSQGNEIDDFAHYEVEKRSDDGKVIILPTTKPLTNES